MSDTPDESETIDVLVAEVGDEDLEELREEGYLRFQFEGDLIERAPIVDVEYVGDSESDDS